MKTRRGASLAELLTVMSACTVILTMSAGLIHRAMRANSQAGAFFNIERTALRLAGQFRRDVHAASRDEAAGEMVLVRLLLADDRQVEYRRLPQGVLRVLSQGGGVVSREEFPFGAAMDVGVREEPSPRRLVLSITSDPSEPDGNAVRASARLRETPIAVQAEAVMGRDQRGMK